MKRKYLLTILLLALFAPLLIANVQAQSTVIFEEDFENGTESWINSTYGSPRPTITSDWSLSGSYSIIDNQDREACMYRTFTNNDPYAPIYFSAYVRWDTLSPPAYGTAAGSGVIEPRDTINYPIGAVELLTLDAGATYRFHCYWFNLTTPTHGIGIRFFSDFAVSAKTTYKIVMGYQHDTSKALTLNFWYNIVNDDGSLKYDTDIPMGSISCVSNDDLKLNLLYVGSAKTSYATTFTDVRYIDDVCVSRDYPSGSVPEPTISPTLTPPPTPTPTLTPSPSTTPIPTTIQVDDNVFIIQSNSTISEVNFQSKYGIADFTVSGLTGTQGFVNTTIAKSILPSLDQFNAYIDGSLINVQKTEKIDYWQIYFTYTHSSHFIRLTLMDAGSNDQFTLLIGVVIVGVVCISALVAVKLRKHTKKHRGKRN